MKVLVVDDTPVSSLAIGRALSRQGAKLAVAINSSTEACEVLVLNFEFAPGDAPPAEMMLVPPGPLAKGRDGRSWNNRDPSGVVRFALERGLDIPVDIEHATELKAPKGEPAPAVAWIRFKNLQVRPDGSVWGAAVEWNPKGTDMMMNREYRYYSPAIIINTQTMDIVGIKSVGLTNTPNFAVPALNREDNNKGGAPMELEQLLASLGLPAGTTFAAALNHIAKMKADHATALNQAQNPSLDLFVPRAEYATALNRATTAEAELQSIKTAGLETAINTEIDAALGAGKITPATKEYYIAQCRQEGGLDRFKDFVKIAPAVAGDTGLDGKDPNKDDLALNSETQKIADMFGNSAEDIKKYGGA